MISDIESLYELQFAVWPEVKDHYLALGKTLRKEVSSPGAPYPVFAQCNPGRAVSTGAKTDKESVANRPCFLCSGNRPGQQLAGKSISGWEILINPFPIFPVHFTVVSEKHEPQGALPLESMTAFLDLEPSCTVFFNGAKAGASAPDHLHFQAILKEELPLLKYLEEHHLPEEGGSSLKRAEDITPNPHYPFRSYIICNDRKGGMLLNEVSARADELSNTFVWGDPQGRLRILLFERKAHRPECYFLPEGERMMVSPGAIDMAGVMILPRKEDFERITPEKAHEIYSQV